MRSGRKTVEFLRYNFMQSAAKMKGSATVQGDLRLQTRAVKDMENVDLEDALDLTGFGKYQFFHCALMLFTMLSAMLEMIGVAFVLPAAACDLQVPDNLKGILTSIPNLGVILTASLWGRAADSLGRKPVMAFSAAVASVMGLLAAFMPNLLGFALCKLAGSLFLSCPSSLCYAYACEMIPKKNRDKTVLICNGLIMLLSTLSPALAWLILPYSWSYQFGVLALRPWRLLTVVYVLPLLLASLLILGIEESPKFLVTRGKYHEALAVLGRVYAVNTGTGPEEYCVKSLKSSSDTASEVSDGSSCELAPTPSNPSAMALLKPPHLKWIALTGFLMFGLFSLLNGLFLFAPDIINKVMNDNEVGTICLLLNQINNNTSSNSTCVDSMSQDTFQIMVITTLIYGVIVMAASLSPLSKKTLLVSMYSIVGIACLISGLTTNSILIGISMSSQQLTSLGIGPLTAYAVRLFPTSLRGTAVGTVLMLGRLGSAVGANVAGLLLAAACTATFYGFTALIFLCAALSFLLPGEESTSDSEDGS